MPGYGQPTYTPPTYPQPAPGGYGVPAYPGPAGSGYPPNAYPPVGYPPTGYPPTGYPAGYAAGSPPMGAPPARPGSVTAAFWLWMAVMAVGVVSTVLLFSGNYFDEIAAQLRAHGLDETGTHAAMAIGAGVARAAVILSAAVSLFIYLFFGLKMATGRHWARVVLTVLGGLSVLSGLSGASALSSGAMNVARPAGVVASAWVQALLAAVAIVAMYLPASNVYFRESRVYRAERRQLRV